MHDGEHTDTKPTEATMTTLATLLETPLTTEAEAEKWVHDMHEIGYGAHPDDSAANLIDFATEAPTFTAEQALHYDERMDEAHALLPDIYETSLDALHAVEVSA